MTLEKKDFFFHIYYFYSKASYQVASIFDMYIIIKWRVYVTPPPPPGPHIAKYVNVFTYM